MILRSGKVVAYTLVETYYITGDGNLGVNYTELFNFGLKFDQFASQPWDHGL